MPFHCFFFSFISDFLALNSFTKHAIKSAPQSFEVQAKSSLTIMDFSRPTAVTASVILVLLLVVSASEAAIQCSDVVKALIPCTNYLKSGGTPTSACCAGVSKLNSLASTSADRKAVCSCLKTAAQQMNPNEAAAKNLPGSCGVTLPVAVSKNVDCSKVT